MRELKWSLRGLRYFFLLMAIIFAVVFFVVYKATGGRNLPEVGYRMLFVVLQLVLCVLFSERFMVVFRRTQFHRFYRSLPQAWEKERNRFFWIDGFVLVCATVVFAIGVMFRNVFAGGTTPTMLLLVFLGNIVVSKALAVLPWWIWWIQEIVFFWLFLLLPMERVSWRIVIGAIGVYLIMQCFMYRMLKKYWYTEE